MNKPSNLFPKLNLKEEASILLTSEIAEIKGGTETSGCLTNPIDPLTPVDPPVVVIPVDPPVDPPIIVTPPDYAMPAYMGCSSCNKTHSCQTHT